MTIEEGKVKPSLHSSSLVVDPFRKVGEHTPEIRPIDGDEKLRDHLQLRPAADDSTQVFDGAFELIGGGRGVGKLGVLGLRVAINLGHFDPGKTAADEIEIDKIFGLRPRDERRQLDKKPPLRRMGTVSPGQVLEIQKSMSARSAFSFENRSKSSETLWTR